MDDVFDSHEEKRTMLPSFVSRNTPAAVLPADSPRFAADPTVVLDSLWPGLQPSKRCAAVCKTGRRGHSWNWAGSRGHREVRTPSSIPGVMGAVNRSMVVRPEVPMREAKRAACTYPAATVQGLGDPRRDRRRGAPR